MGQGKFEKKPESKKQKNTTAKNQENTSGSGKASRTALKVLIVILSIVLVVLLVVAFAMNFVLGKINRYDNNDYTAQTVAEEFSTEENGEETYETVDPDSVTWDEVETISDEDIINILLIGQDARPGETRARSDTMILVSLNTKTNSIQMTSFMRDLYVQLPGYSDNRINAAFALGGPELLNDTLNVNFGVVVDGNVAVNFTAFSEIIDILGGVDIEIDSEEAWYLRNDGISASEGMNHFDGEAALSFARMRYVSGGDYTRTERQRRVITSIIESFKGASISQLLSVVNDVLPYVTTDLTDSEIISYVTKGLSALNAGGEMSSLRIPADDAHYGATIRGMSVLVPDLEMCQEDLREFLYSSEQ